jgi:hypothetical protein
MILALIIFRLLLARNLCDNNLLSVRSIELRIHLGETDAGMYSVESWNQSTEKQGEDL